MLTEKDRQEWNEEDLTGEILRLNDTILALVLGLMTGLLVFVATNWLVIKGGNRVGPHLALLGQFFPGYRSPSWVVCSVWRMARCLGPWPAGRSRGCTTGSRSENGNAVLHPDSGPKQSHESGLLS